LEKGRVARAAASPVVVKLGGSIATDKSSPFTYRGEAVLRLAKEVALSGRRVVLVHGGGSFGHSAATKYGLSSRTTRSSTEGVSETRAAMYRLDLLVCSSLAEAGLKPYPFSPFDLLLKGSRPAAWITALLNAGLVPVTFGDVVRRGDGFTILSGDTIAYDLCRLLRPARCIFVLDADGVYDEKGALIPDLATGRIGHLKLDRSDDATGGIRLKLREASRIAALGVDAVFVSGRSPEEFAKALKMLSFHGTIVRKGVLRSVQERQG